MRIVFQYFLLGGLLIDAASQVVADDAPEKYKNNSGEILDKKLETDFDEGLSDPVTIVVTPLWRPVDIDKLPFTIYAQPGKELDATGIHNTIDLQYKVPGLVFKTNAVLGQPYVRGVGSDLISAGTDASVATFVDSVYQTRAIRSIQDFFDLERVEILKGPQGVLLGRNAVGGTVSIITRDPDPYVSGFADVLYGSYHKKQFRGAVNTPIGDSDLFFRLSGMRVLRDGYTDNIFLDKDIDDEDYGAIRGKLRYAPSGDFDVVFGVEHTAEGSTRALAPQVDPNQGVSGALMAGGTVPGNPRKVTSNVDQFLDVNTTSYTAKIFRKFEPFELLSITGYQDMDLDMLLDTDTTEVDFSLIEVDEPTRAFTQEIRLTSAPELGLGWVAGAFFLRENAEQDLDTQLPLFGVQNLSRGEIETESYAIFGELSLQPVQQWRGSAGVRYSYDERSIDFRQTITDPGGVLGPPGTVAVVQEESENWDAITPEFGVEYTPDSNTHYYARVSRGYKSGGYSTSAVQPSFKPEFLWSYELGLKSTLPQWGFRFNSSLFYYDYEDIQLLTPPENAVAGTFPVIINAANATIKGLELETSLQATQRLGLSLSLTLLDSEFEDFVSSDPNNPTDDPDRSGNSLPQAPDLSLNAGAKYDRHLANGGLVTIRGGYRYQSSVFYSVYRDRATKQDGFGLWDASVTYDSPKGHWYAELFGKNLSDELYQQNVINQQTIFGVLQFWGAPRTVGLRVGYRH